MELKKVDGGVWVKASEELPDKTAKYFVRYEQVHRGCAWFDEGDWFIWEHNQPKTKINPSEWLKPIEQVYPLTETDIENIIQLFNAYLILKGNPDLPMIENIKNFIQSLNK